MTLRLVTALGLALAMAGCSLPGGGDGPGRAIANPDALAEPTPRPEPPSRYGNPDSYTVNGERYHTLDSAAGYNERGVASWYGSKFHGRRTSSGETFDMYRLTAAHRSLPLPTFVEVTHLGNGRSIVVRVNDRGPFADDRIIDLSYGAAAKLRMLKSGTARVRVRALTPGEPHPPERTAASTPVGGSGGYWVQVGAFRDRDNAFRMLGRVEASGVEAPARVREPADGEPFYRVHVGPVDTRGRAERLAERLAGDGVPTGHVIGVD